MVDLTQLEERVSAALADCLKRSSKSGTPKRRRLHEYDVGPICAATRAAVAIAGPEALSVEIRVVGGYRPARMDNARGDILTITVTPGAGLTVSASRARVAGSREPGRYRLVATAIDTNGNHRAILSAMPDNQPAELWARRAT